MSNLKRGSVAIVGAAESDLGAVPAGTSPLDLIAQATTRALDDAGLKLSDIDGAFVSSNQMRMVPQNVCEYFGMQPKYFDSTNIGGASSLTQLAHAQAAIEAGQCTTALIVYGSTQRLASRAQASPREYWFYESVYRPFLPPSGYALAASRHMHEFGTTREHLAQVAADGNGPVSALDSGVRKALMEVFPGIGAVHLSDYKVRIINPGGGANAAVRVLVESTDGVHIWRTVGASTDVVEASWLALQDSYEFWVAHYREG